MTVSFPNISCSLSSLVDVLRCRVSSHPNERAFTYLSNEKEESSITYEGLDRQARAIGATLQATVLPGSRALLLYPPGLDFIAAFFGCLYAGVIAVPTYLPRGDRKSRGLLTISSIMSNADPTLILTTSNLSVSVKSALEQIPDFQNRLFLITSDISLDRATEWKELKLGGDALAFLQYTSGSTGTPKGTMLSHTNLLQNIALIWRQFDGPTNIVCWLPPYHDMGLIGNILGSICFDTSATLLAPTAFLQYPFRWLAAISQFRAETSGGPNFAYDLCVRRISAQQRETLDLSCWKRAFVGAEPIRQETLDRFAETFAPCGFRREAFFPCYGLAEATLFVTGGPRGIPPVIQAFDEKALAHDQVVPVSEDDPHGRTLVSSGEISPEARVVIVDPETFKPCPPDRVGEIWIIGPSVARGYWNRPEETASTFKAYLADSREGPFLRTGDLGIIYEGKLFVTGRLKDLIIIRGQNFYPQDIELVVEKCHEAIRPNGCAAISVRNKEKEELVVLAEIDPYFIPSTKERGKDSLNSKKWKIIDPQDIVTAVRRSVAEHFDLSVSQTVLLNAGGIPRTSSGKIRRRICCENFLEGNLSYWGN